MNHDADRRTGRTTLLAVKLLAEAMENPGKDFAVVDHHHTRLACEHLWKLLQDMVDDLRLSEFAFTSKKEGYFVVFTQPRLLGEF